MAGGFRHNCAENFRFLNWQRPFTSFPKHLKAKSLTNNDEPDSETRKILAEKEKFYYEYEHYEFEEKEIEYEYEYEYDKFGFNIDHVKNKSFNYDIILIKNKYDVRTRRNLGINNGRHLLLQGYERYFPRVHEKTIKRR